MLASHVGGAATMDRRHSWPRIKCDVPLCWNDGKMDRMGEWESNDYCEYIEVRCHTCHALYWMVKRDGKVQLQKRSNGDSFDNRKSSR